MVRVGLLDLATIFAAARDARQSCDFEEPPYSTTVLVEVLLPGVLVTGTHALPPKVIEQVVVAPEGRTIFYNRKVATGAQRVGIAHAVAHLLFDASGGPMSRGCAINFSSGQLSLDTAERRADLFAGEVLLPMVELDALAGPALFPKDPVGAQEFDDLVDQCASRYKVPPGFVRWRLWDLLHLRRTNFFVTD